MYHQFSQFRHFWKIDDPHWVQKRESDWQKIHVSIYRNYEDGAEELTLARQFFLLGENGHRIFGLARIFLAPLATPDDARALFYSSELGRGTRIELLEQYFRVYHPAYRVESYKSQCRNIAEGIYGSSFDTLISSIKDFEGEEPDHSPHFICNQFIHALRRVVQGRSEFNGHIYLIDFFVSLIASVEDERDAIGTQLHKLFNDAAYALTREESTNLMKDTARQLLAVEGACVANWGARFVANPELGGKFTEHCGGWLLGNVTATNIKSDGIVKTAKDEMKQLLHNQAPLREYLSSINDTSGMYRAQEMHWPSDLTRRRGFPCPSCSTNQRQWWSITHSTSAMKANFICLR